MNVLRIIDELRTDPILAHLTPARAEAVLLALHVIGRADTSLGTREETELEHMLLELPWWEGKEADVRAASERVMQRVDAARGAEVALRALLDAAAAQLSEQPVREKVYAMAARLGWVDQHLDPGERRAMRWLAEAFGIDPDDAERLLFAAAR